MPVTPRVDGMHTTRRRRSAVAVALATLLVLLSGGPTLASWSATDPISDPSRRAVADPGAALAAISGSSIGIVYAEQRSSGLFRVLFRRSTNGGATWQAPTVLSSASTFAEMPAIFGADGTFDVVWIEEDANGDHRLWYARSRDGGLTWRARQRLSTDEDAFAPRVARSRSGVVAITWVRFNSGSPPRLFSRVSTNGGSDFGPREPLADVEFDTKPAVAIGKNNKIHVAYNDDGLQYQRSGDRGETWSQPEQLSTTAGFWAPGLAASGMTLIVGYVRSDGAGDEWVVYRRSQNNGFDWESSRALSRKELRLSFAVVLSVRDGRWRAAFARCTETPCTEDSVETLLRKSSNGGDSWTSAERVSTTSGSAIPLGANGGTRSVVAWLRQDGFGSISRIYARREE